MNCYTELFAVGLVQILAFFALFKHAKHTKSVTKGLACNIALHFSIKDATFESFCGLFVCLLISVFMLATGRVNPILIVNGVSLHKTQVHNP